MRTPPRILIVDDNPTNVKVLQTRLAAEGYEVLTAHDGQGKAARDQFKSLGAGDKANLIVFLNSL